MKFYEPQSDGTKHKINKCMYDYIYKTMPDKIYILIDDDKEYNYNEHEASITFESIITDLLSFLEVNNNIVLPEKIVISLKKLLTDNLNELFLKKIALSWSVTIENIFKSMINHKRQLEMLLIVLGKMYIDSKFKIEDHYNNIIMNNEAEEYINNQFGKRFTKY